MNDFETAIEQQPHFQGVRAQMEIHKQQRFMLAAAALGELKLAGAGSAGPGGCDLHFPGSGELHPDPAPDEGEATGLDIVCVIRGPRQPPASAPVLAAALGAATPVSPLLSSSDSSRSSSSGASSSCCNSSRSSGSTLHAADLRPTSHLVHPTSPNAPPSWSNRAPQSPTPATTSDSAGLLRFQGLAKATGRPEELQIQTSAWKQPGPQNEMQLQAAAWKLPFNESSASGRLQQVCAC